MNSSASKTSPKNHSFREILSTYKKYAKGSGGLITICIVLLIIDAGMQVAIPGIMGTVIDGLTRDAGAFVKHAFPILIPATIIGSIVFYFVAFIWHYLNFVIGQQIATRFRINLYNHLQQLSADFYQRNHVGEITTRMTNDIQQAFSPIFNQFFALLWGSILLIISSITMILMNVYLFLCFCVVGVAFGILTRIITPRIRRYNREVQDTVGRMNARITEDISANALIRAFAQEESSMQAVEQFSNEYLAKSIRTGKITTMFSDLINAFMAIFSPLTILIIGALFVYWHQITVGMAVAFYGYWRVASWPISSILNGITSVFSAFASMDRLLDFFNERPMVKDTFNAKPLVVREGEVSFSDVTFCYPIGEKKRVLNRINLTVPAHTSMAIVGESGAGKSTMTSLILRFYDPVSGAISIDGQNISGVQQASLRQQIGLVMQETILLSGTIRENMQFAKPGACDDEIITALQHAEAWSFVNGMPEKLDTILGERGARLSGGQKQRISIARVFLKNPPIVVFDEATSSLDTITEKQIQETMRRLYEGRTALIIAHRLSTIIDCDSIVVLEGGTILGQGPHEELQQTCQRYRELCQKQMVGKSLW